MVVSLFFYTHTAFSQTDPYGDIINRLNVPPEVKDALKNRLEILKSIVPGAENIPSAEEARREAIEGMTTIVVDPPTPDPYETVQISVENYVLDINSTDIFWYVDGKMLTGGPGLKKISLKVGGPGEKIHVRATIYSTKEGEISKTVTIIPLEADLLWQADTYTPPFYKGKALPTAQGTVKVVVMPNFILDGKRKDANKLVYIWRNGESFATLEDNSGYGKRWARFRIENIYGDLNTSVSIYPRFQKDTVKIKKLTVNPVTPETILYENNPLYGIQYENAIGGDKVWNSAFSVKAEPYFFSKNDVVYGNISFKWTLNNELLSILDNSDTLTISMPPTEETGNEFNVQVFIENPGKYGQYAENGFTVTSQQPVTETPPSFF